MSTLRPEYWIELKQNSAETKTDAFIAFVTQGRWLKPQQFKVQLDENGREAWRFSLIRAINASWVRRMFGAGRSLLIPFVVTGPDQSMEFRAFCVQDGGKSMGAIQLIKVGDYNVIGNPDAAKLGQIHIDQKAFDEFYLVQ